MKRHANAPPPPCPRCLKLAWADRIRKETVMPIPDDPPLSREDNKPCCYDCAAADGLMALINAPNEGREKIVKPLLWKTSKRKPYDEEMRGLGFSFVMARICVGNDRQEQLRLPGAPMGLVYFKMMRPSEPGDLEKHHKWMDKVGLGEGGI